MFTVSPLTAFCPPRTKAPDVIAFTSVGPGPGFGTTPGTVWWGSGYGPFPVPTLTWSSTVITLNPPPVIVSVSLGGGAVGYQRLIGAGSWFVQPAPIDGVEQSVQTHFGPCNLQGSTAVSATETGDTLPAVGITLLSPLFDPAAADGAPNSRIKFTISDLTIPWPTYTTEYGAYNTCTVGYNNYTVYNPGFSMVYWVDWNPPGIRYTSIPGASNTSGGSVGTPAWDPEENCFYQEASAYANQNTVLDLYLTGMLCSQSLAGDSPATSPNAVGYVSYYIGRIQQVPSISNIYAFTNYNNALAFAGDTVKIEGAGFSSGMTATVNAESAAIFCCNDFECLVTLPADCATGTATIQVITSGGTASGTITVGTVPSRVALPSGWIEIPQVDAAWAFSCDIQASNFFTAWAQEWNGPLTKSFGASYTAHGPLIGIGHGAGLYVGWKGPFPAAGELEGLAKVPTNGWPLLDIPGEGQVENPDTTAMPNEMFIEGDVVLPNVSGHEPWIRGWWNAVGTVGYGIGGVGPETVGVSNTMTDGCPYQESSVSRSSAVNFRLGVYYAQIPTPSPPSRPPVYCQHDMGALYIWFADANTTIKTTCAGVELWLRPWGSLTAIGSQPCNIPFSYVVSQTQPDMPAGSPMPHLGIFSNVYFSPWLITTTGWDTISPNPTSITTSIDETHLYVDQGSTSNPAAGGTGLRTDITTPAIGLPYLLNYNTTQTVTSKWLDTYVCNHDGSLQPDEVQLANDYSSFQVPQISWQPMKPTPNRGISISIDPSVYPASLSPNGWEQAIYEVDTDVFADEYTNTQIPILLPPGPMNPLAVMPSGSGTLSGFGALAGQAKLGSTALPDFAGTLALYPAGSLSYTLGPPPAGGGQPTIGTGAGSFTLSGSNSFCGLSLSLSGLSGTVGAYGGLTLTGGSATGTLSLSGIVDDGAFTFSASGFACVACDGIVMGDSLLTVSISVTGTVSDGRLTDPVASITIGIAGKLSNGGFGVWSSSGNILLSANLGTEIAGSAAVNFIGTWKSTGRYYRAKLEVPQSVNAEIVAGARPANWIPSGEGLTITQSGTDPAVFTAGSAGNSASLTLATNWSHYIDKPIMGGPGDPPNWQTTGYEITKANWWHDIGGNSPAQIVYPENIWYWATWGWYNLNITVPSDCTMTVRLDWTELSVDDPHTGGWDRINGTGGSGDGMVFTSTAKYGVWTVNLDSGSNDVTQDLIFPDAGGPMFTGRIDKITLGGFPVGATTLNFIGPCVNPIKDGGLQPSAGKLHLQCGTVIYRCRWILEQLQKCIPVPEPDWSMFQLEMSGSDAFGGILDTVNKPNESNAIGGGSRYIDPAESPPDSEVWVCSDTQKNLTTMLAELNQIQGINIVFDPAAYATAVTDAFGNIQPIPLAQALVEVGYENPWIEMVLDPGANVYRAILPIMLMCNYVINAAGIDQLIQGERELFGNARMLVGTGTARSTSGTADLYIGSEVYGGEAIDQNGMAYWPRVPANSLIDYEAVAS